MKEESRSVSTGSGVQFVMTTGDIMMPWWFADNLVSEHKVSITGVSSKTSYYNSMHHLGVS